MDDTSRSADQTVATRVGDERADTGEPLEQDAASNPAGTPARAADSVTSWAAEGARAGDPWLTREPRGLPALDDEPGHAPIPSTAQVDGHPLHPMVVPLPIGALSLALVSDLAYAATGDRFFARASSGLLVCGIASGLVAGALGATDFLGRREIRRHRSAWLHGLGNLSALGMSTVSLIARRRRGETFVVPAGLAMSLAAGGVLLMTGWLGGELSYRHRIGVVPS